MSAPTAIKSAWPLLINPDRGNAMLDCCWMAIDRLLRTVHYQVMMFAAHMYTADYVHS